MGAGHKTAVIEVGDPQVIPRLVTIRQVHQTRRAAKSTKDCKPSALPSSVSTTQSQRHQVCSQMADVIRRSGTGIERNTRWKSGSAPGTKDAAEVSQLSGNSANAELAAKERMNEVHIFYSPPTALHLNSHRGTQAAGLRARFFNDNSIHLSRFLVDGLVGNDDTPPPNPVGGWPLGGCLLGRTYIPG